MPEHSQLLIWLVVKAYKIEVRTSGCHLQVRKTNHQTGFAILIQIEGNFVFKDLYIIKSWKRVVLRYEAEYVA
jgi:hypothetical protein